MASSFVLTLDTHAPQLTWGAIAGADAGALLRVAYTVDEPGVQSATLRFDDGRQLAMSVYPDRLEVLLPYDASSGATIDATVVDSVGNTASYQHAPFVITGGVGPPPTPTANRAVAPIPTGPSPRTPERQERRIDSRSSARGASTTRVVTRREAAHGRSVGRSSNVVQRGPLRATAKATLGSSWQYGAGHRLGNVASTGSTIEVTRRRDGQEIEALLLDLL